MNYAIMRGKELTLALHETFGHGNAYPIAVFVSRQWTFAAVFKENTLAIHVYDVQYEIRWYLYICSCDQASFTARRYVRHKGLNDTGMCMLYIFEPQHGAMHITWRPILPAIRRNYARA